MRITPLLFNCGLRTHLDKDLEELMSLNSKVMNLSLMGPLCDSKIHIGRGRNDYSRARVPKKRIFTGTRRQLMVSP